MTMRSVFWGRLSVSGVGGRGRGLSIWQQVGLGGECPVERDFQEEHKVYTLGARPVFQASTLHIHHKEMDKVPCMYPPNTSQVHSEFSLPVFLQFPWPGECPVHSQCPRSHDCDVPINFIMGTS